MAAWQCPKCKLALPAPYAPAASPCPVCDTRLVYYTLKNPDKDWQRKVNAARGEDAPASAGATAVAQRASLIYRDDTETYHVADAELRRLGKQPQDFDVVELNGRFYELSGIDRSTATWWLEPIDPESELLDLEELPVRDDHEEPLWIYVELEDDD